MQAQFFVFCFALMALVQLTKGFHAIVDDEDLDRVAVHKWCASIESRGTKVYAIRWKTINGKQTKIRLHHFVLGIEPGALPEGHCVDHVNGDGLDCTKANLEVVTFNENMRRCENWKKKEMECYL